MQKGISNSIILDRDVKEVSAGKLSHILSDCYINSYKIDNLTTNELEKILYDDILSFYGIEELEYREDTIDGKKLRNVNGRELHRLLGYENSVTPKFILYKFNDKLYKIVGSPDRVNEKSSENELVVEELKTYKNKRNRIPQMIKGIFQLAYYSYIYQTEEGILVMIDLNKGTKETFYFNFPYYAQSRTLEDGLSIYDLLFLLKQT